MATHAPSKPPDLAELMKMFQEDEIEDPLHGDRAELSPPRYTQLLPPNPPVATAVGQLKCPSKQHIHRQAGPTETLFKDTAASRFRRQDWSGEERAGGWNGSTQVAKGLAKPLKHQILNRNFMPPAPNVVERKATKQLLNRLSKGTVSSRMKEAAAPMAATHVAHTTGVVEVDRKRLHLQQKQAVAAVVSSRSPEVRGGREGIQLLLFYRKEVEKRLRQDPLYALHQDAQLPY